MRGKKKKADRDRKVIPFPGLAERLIERGLDSLREKDFENAAKFFGQAKEFDPENPEMNIGLVVSLVELGIYREAKDLCKELLLKGIGDYFQVVNIYLMILLNLNEHQEMIDTIKALLEEKQVPADKEEHFHKMLEFCERSVKEPESGLFPAEDEESNLHEDLAFLEEKTEEEQLLLISQLAHANIRPFINKIKAFLSSPEAHPFLKTLLVNILKEQDIQEKVIVEKFGRIVTVIPAHLPDLLETDFLTHTLSELESILIHENPTLLEISKSLVERHNFLLYPLEPQGEEYRDWAAAYHFLTEEYQGESMQLNTAAELYKGNLENITVILTRIRGFEEISYPII